MQLQSFTNFEPGAHGTWQSLFEGTHRSRLAQAHPLFVEGLNMLHITGEHIPDLPELNRRLASLTGWQMVPVEGLEGPEAFFSELSEKKFSGGNFIRNREDLTYTPAPDVFHDVYGHIPFFAHQRYADFCQSFGIQACRYLADKTKLREYERLFWFGVEFPLIKTPHGIRIFGGGILSSSKECDYCLSSEPEVRPFDLENIRRQEYRIDQVQPIVYLLDSPDQLFNCLKDY